VANHIDPEHDTTRLAIKTMINVALATGGVGGTPLPVPRSGFVVRSAIVKAAPDLRVTVTRFNYDTEAKKWAEDTAYDPLLRHTRLDDYTILCLVDVLLDQICKISLAQPPHQQRFSFSVQPTFDPDSGAVTAITNELKLSSLYTNEAVAPEGHGPAGEWPELPLQYQLSPSDQVLLYDSTTRCIDPGEIARNVNRQLMAWNAADSSAPYADTAPDSCVVGLQLNDPCCMFLFFSHSVYVSDFYLDQLDIYGTKPTVTGAFKNDARQLWVGAANTQSGLKALAPSKLAVVSSKKTLSSVLEAAASTSPPSQPPLKIPHFTKSSLTKTPTSLLHPQQLLLNRTSVIPRSLAATPTRASRQPTMPPPADFASCQFELLIHPDYRQPPPRPFPAWKYDARATYSPQTQLPMTPIYLYDMVLAVRRRPRHTPGNYELQELHIEIPVEDPSDTHNPSDNMWREPLLVGGDYSGKGVQMTGNDRFVPTLSSADHSSDDGKACLRVTLIPRTGEAQGTVLLKDDSASAEASVRLAEVRLAQIVDTRTRVLLVKQKGKPAVSTPAGRCFVKMTEVYASGQPDQLSWAVVLKTKDRDQDQNGHDL
jgi:hypothetical protein